MWNKKFPRGFRILIKTFEFGISHIVNTKLSDIETPSGKCWWARPFLLGFESQLWFAISLKGFVSSCKMSKPGLWILIRMDPHSFYPPGSRRANFEYKTEKNARKLVVIVFLFLKMKYLPVIVNMDQLHGFYLKSLCFFFNTLLGNFLQIL